MKVLSIMPQMIQSHVISKNRQQPPMGAMKSNESQRQNVSFGLRFKFNHTIFDHGLTNECDQLSKGINMSIAGIAPKDALVQMSRTTEPRYYLFANCEQELGEDSKELFKTEILGPKGTPPRNHVEAVAYAISGNMFKRIGEQIVGVLK